MVFNSHVFELEKQQSSDEKKIKNMECPICFFFFNDNAYATVCGHIFCKPCIDKVIPE